MIGSVTRTAWVPSSLSSDNGERWVRGPGGVLLRVWTGPQRVRRRRRGEALRLVVAVAVGVAAALAVQ